MEPKVFDVYGEMQDWDWLRSKYGARIYSAQATGTRFALTEVREQRDNTSIWVSVLDENGAPKHTQPIANHWPDPTLTDLTKDPTLKSVYFDRANVRYTNLNGLAEWNFGGGSVIKDGGGPHSLWVLSPTYPSDIIYNIGWLGGTNHWGPLYFVFRIEKANLLRSLWERFLKWVRSLFAW